MSLIYSEELPNNCPPEDAAPPASKYYRIGSNPPQEEDFFSHRKLYPFKAFKVGECRARSVSIFDTLESVDIIRNIAPTLKNKYVLEVDLVEKDGVVLQTGNNNNHYSWWKSANFDFNNCTVIL